MSRPSPYGRKEPFVIFSKEGLVLGVSLEERIRELRDAKAWAVEGGGEDKVSREHEKGSHRMEAH